MNIKFRDQNYYFEPITQTIQEVDRYIQEIAIINQLDINHIVVDGVSYYGDIEKALDNASITSEVRIIERGSSEWLADILNTSEQYLGSALQKLPLLAASFQQGEEAISWDQFKELLSGIEWLEEVNKLIAHSSFTNVQSFFSEQVMQINQLMKSLLESLEENDYILTGDIINYELVEIYRAFYEGIEKVQIEGLR